MTRVSLCLLPWWCSGMPQEKGHVLSLLWGGGKLLHRARTVKVAVTPHVHRDLLLSGFILTGLVLVMCPG